MNMEEFFTKIKKYDLISEVITDFGIISEVLTAPFRGMYKDAASTQSFIMLVVVSALACLGFSELFSIYLPQFYDKVELPIFGVWEKVSIFILIPVVGILITLIGEKLISCFSHTRLLPDWLPSYLRLFFFFIMIGLMIKVGRDYTGTMKGYRTLLGQFSYLTIGFSLFIYVSDLPLRKLSRISGYSVAIFSFLMGILQFLPWVFGESKGGATRTIFQIQVLDFVFLFIVFGLAWLGTSGYLQKKKNWSFCLSVVIIFLIIYKCQGNGSSACVCCAIMFLAAWWGEIITFPEIETKDIPILKQLCGGKPLFKWLFDKDNKGAVIILLSAALLLCTVLAVCQITSCQIGKTGGTFREARIINWFNYDADVFLKPPMKNKYALTDAYSRYKNNKGAQAYYSKLAIINGRKNILPHPGSCEVNNRRKLDVAMSDFFFAVLCGEYGFLFMFLLILFVAAFISYYTKLLTYPNKTEIVDSKDYDSKDYDSLVASKQYEYARGKYGNGDKYLRYLAINTITYFCVIILAHVYVNLSLAPNTGLPLPLFSNGGISLIVSLTLLGVLFNLTKRPAGTGDWTGKND